MTANGRTRRHEANGHALPPHDPVAERNVLGSILLDPPIVARVSEVLDASDFYIVQHMRTYIAMLGLHADGKRIDTTLLFDALDDSGTLDTDHNATLAFLAELSDVPTAANVGFYAEIVRKKSVRRRLKNMGLHLAQVAADPHGDDADLESIIAELRGASNPSRSIGAVLTPMSDFEARSVDWLWPDRIPSGRITLLVGLPGAGKTFLTTDLAARISTGTPWPDGRPCVRGSAIMMAAEDDPHDTLRPRLDAHKADCSRIYLLSAVRSVGDGGKPQERMVTLADLPAIEQALRAVPDCRAIIVDPIGSFLGGRVDAHRDNEVRAILAPIASLAEKHNVAAIIVAHRRKASSTSADDLAIGSRAFTGIARAVWHLSRDPHNKRRRLFLAGKANLAAEQDGLAFEITGEPARAWWELDPVTMSADDAVAAEAKEAKGGSAVAEAVEWLRQSLAEGPKAANVVQAEADQQGISERTLRRAREAVGIVCKPAGFGRPWLWELPSESRTH